MEDLKKRKFSIMLTTPSIINFENEISTLLDLKRNEKVNKKK